MSKITIFVVMFIMLNLVIVSGCENKKESYKYLKLAKESHENAEQYFNRLKGDLSDLTPKEIIVHRRGYIEEKQKEIKAYEKIIKINPQILKKDDYIKLGEAYLAIIDDSIPSTQTPSEKRAIVHKAIKSFRSALKIDFQNVEARMGLSSAYFQIKQSDIAIEECKKLLSLRPKNADAHAMIGEIFRLSGKYGLAKESLQKAIEIDPKCIKARLSLVAIYLNEGEVNRALDEIKGILDIDPRNWEAAHLLRMTRDAGSTVSKIEETLKENPMNVQLLVELGRAYTTLSNLSKAREAYEKAYSLQPKGDASIAVELGRVLLFDYENTDREKIKRAIEILEREKTSAPKDLQIKITLAKGYKAIGAYDKAIKEYKEIVREAPKYALAWYYLGETYEAIGDNKRANDAFKKSAKLTIAFNEEILKGE